MSEISEDSNASKQHYRIIVYTPKKSPKKDMTAKLLAKPASKSKRIKSCSRVKAKDRDSSNISESFSDFLSTDRLTVNNQKGLATARHCKAKSTRGSASRSNTRSKRGASKRLINKSFRKDLFKEAIDRLKKENKQLKEKLEEKTKELKQKEVYILNFLEKFNQREKELLNCKAIIKELGIQLEAHQEAIHRLKSQGSCTTHLSKNKSILSKLTSDVDFELSKSSYDLDLSESNLNSAIVNKSLKHSEDESGCLSPIAQLSKNRDIFESFIMQSSDDQVNNLFKFQVNDELNELLGLDESAITPDGKCKDYEPEMLSNVRTKASSDDSFSTPRKYSSRKLIKCTFPN